MLTLQQFLHPVPICQSSVTVTDIIALFESGQHEGIVVVDESESPLGFISSRHLLSLLLKQSVVPIAPSSKSSRTRSPLSKPVSLGNLEDLLTPLVLIPENLSLKDFPLYLQARNLNLALSHPYGLVGPGGEFLGLLDSGQILQALLNHTDLPQPSFSHSESLLSELLEQFPLPVMLQTNQGKILQQNGSWREQIGEFIPPDNASACPLSSQQLQPIATPATALAATQNSYGAESFVKEVSLAAHLSCSQWLKSLPERSKLSESFPNPGSLHPLLPSPTSLVKHNPGQERVWQFVKCPLTTEYGEISLVLATDVTEQQRLCQELSAKNADLVQLNRLKDEFLACISHELKSPLTAVVGLSSLLGEQKVGELNARQVHYAQLIYRSGRQLMTLVNDLLDLTRLETGQLKLTFMPLNIKSICERAYRSISEKYKDKTDTPPSFTLKIEPGLKFIFADELRLHQMLVHLLDNAMKFTQSGGEVGITVNHWEEWIAINVWDTGIGIPEEAQHLIFQKFQQLENPLTRKFEGTGLGLVLTQRLARAHGGEISFISKAGQGSQFTLLLPPTAGSQDQKSEPNSQKNPYPLVLIVEAIPNCIEDLMDKLTQLGYRVVIARTGTEAVEKARQLRPYAILLNPLLPLLSGWDVLTLLKSDPQTRKIRVFMTATENHQALHEPNQADGFLSVPLDLPVLKTILGNVNPVKKAPNRSLTILRLYPGCAHGQSRTIPLCSPLEWALIDHLSQSNHRILEADDLEQAEMLTNVWQVDVVILDGRCLEDPTDYMRSLSEQAELATLPLVTLDLKTTEAANQVAGLSVFPCLIPENKENAQQLWQVIQIAASSQA